LLDLVDVELVSGLDTQRDTYATVGPALMICQLLAVLEIIHPLLRWVRTGVILPIIQVSPSVNGVLYFEF